MKRKRLSKKERETPGPNFRGYLRNWDNNKKAFKDPVTPYKVNEEALNMITNDDGKKYGRPKISSGKNVHSAATDKLQELDFDPLDELLRQLEDIEKLIQEEQASDTPRGGFINNMQTARLRILETILPYRYGKAPTVTTETTDPRQPIRIILSNDDSTST